MGVETFKTKGLKLSAVFRIQADNLQNLKRKKKNLYLVTLQKNLRILLAHGKKPKET